MKQFLIKLKDQVASNKIEPISFELVEGFTKELYIEALKMINAGARHQVYLIVMFAL